MNQNSYKLYILICPLDKCVRYVGITTQSLDKRLKSGHLSSYKKDNPHKFYWIQKLKKQNLKPEIKLVCENLSETKACAMEIELIKQYRYLVGDKLTNIHEGGNLPPKAYGNKWNIGRGKKHSLESKEKISQNHSKYWKGKKVSQEIIEKRKRIGSNSKFFGKKLSLDVKRKISENNFWKNKIGFEHNRSKPIIQYDLNGNYIATFGSIRQASIKTKIHVACIGGCCRGRQKSAGNYIWSFLKKEE